MNSDDRCHHHDNLRNRRHHHHRHCDGVRATTQHELLLRKFD